MNLSKKQTEYIKWVNELKNIIQKTQIKASIAVNKELLNLYWVLGKSISEKVNKEKWGSSTVENLSKDLKNEFPYQKGFSRSNLFSMKKWYEFYSKSDENIKKIQQLVGQIPWGHNIIITAKSKSIDEAIFYIKKTIENNWSRSILTHQIELNFYGRQGKAITNFNKTLPETNSELATLNAINNKKNE